MLLDDDAAAQLDLFRVLSADEVAVFAHVVIVEVGVVRSAWRRVAISGIARPHPRPTGGFRLNTVGVAPTRATRCYSIRCWPPARRWRGLYQYRRDSAGGDDSTLLSSLQDAIDHDTIPDVVPLDRTVVIHRTFGATRRVEVLRDHLLHLFNGSIVTGRRCLRHGTLWCSPTMSNVSLHW